MRSSDVLPLLHRTARALQRAGAGHRPDRRGRAVAIAGGAISQRHPAHRVGDHALSGRERQDGHGYGGAADRAAGQRRAGHALHAVDQRQRRHLHLDRDLRDRHRSEHGAGAGAEPGVGGARAIAAAGVRAGRQRPEEVDRGADVRDAHVTGQPLRRPVPRQLWRHQPAERARAPAGHRQRQRVRRRPVRDAHLDGPEPAAGARAHAERRDQRHPAAEPGGHRRLRGHAADAGRAELPIHGEHHRPLQ